MSETVVQQLLAPVPNLSGVTKPQGTDLTPAQQKAFDEVLAHFSKPDYELSASKDEDKKLRDDEKFWLVCPHGWLGGLCSCAR